MERINQLYESINHLNKEIMNKLIKIALVDDEQLFVEGLSFLLGTENFITVVSATNEGQSFLNNLGDLATNDFPDIALIDIQMDPMNGFELAEKLKQIYPDLHIIVLSSHYKHAILGQMIKIGVSAFLPKNASRELLIEAITKVYYTGVYFSAKDYEMLSLFAKSHTKNRYFSPSDELSDREKEVLVCICDENTNTEIAEKLYLSKRTVESHRQNLLFKTKVKNTAGLVIYAICHEIYIPSSTHYF
jgi:DNA-binding NarL/FixJ family response regulator